MEDLQPGPVEERLFFQGRSTLQTGGRIDPLARGLRNPVRGVCNRQQEFS